MRYYPILLDLEDKKCCVVGGGKVAERKAQTLLKAGACVWVISPVLTKGLSGLCRKKKSRHIKSAYQKRFLKNSFLVICATNNSEINAQVLRDAREAGILTNVVDAPLKSNFIVPSVIERDGLIISISTSGKAPCLAKRMRIDLTKHFIPRYVRALKPLGGFRENLKSSCSKAAIRKAVLTKWVNSVVRKRDIRREL